MHIHGHGVHDNGHPDDADSFLREFVSALRHRGHVVHAAHFTAGTAQDLTSAAGETSVTVSAVPDVVLKAPAEAPPADTTSAEPAP
jgi:LmbE family N-acetylglucosaminyl deacetylase